jgi:hypothetical protein
VECLVCAESENSDCRSLALDDCRHGGGNDVGAVRANQEVDFVDAHQFFIYSWRIRRTALIVVINELHRAAEQAAFLVDIVAPDLEAGQHLLARWRGRPGQAETESNTKSISSVGRCCR